MCKSHHGVPGPEDEAVASGNDFTQGAQGWTFSYTLDAIISEWSKRVDRLVALDEIDQ